MKIKLLTTTAMIGLLMTGCNLNLPKLPEPSKVQSNNQTTETNKDIGDIATKKANQLTKKECQILLEMEKESHEAKKLADEETRVKGRNKVKGSVYFDAADKYAKLKKIYYLTEKLNYCKSLNEEKIDIDIDKIMEKNK